MNSRWIVKVLLAAVTIATGAGAAADGLVTGTASFRERIALPPRVTFEAILEDVSRADAKPVEIGRTRDEDAGDPPYDFSVEYDPDVIDEDGAYTVRARLLLDRRLMFTSDMPYPVITRGAPLDVDIEMAMVGRDEGAQHSTLGFDRPITFLGDLPCGECEAVRHHLNLWPDRVFQLRRRWRGTDLTQDIIGQWSGDPARDLLTLESGEDRLEFLVVAPDRLRLTARDGAEIEGGEASEITATDIFEPLDLRLPLRGMVTVLADSARILECLSGRSYTLSREGDFATLESAYLASGVAQGSRLMASFDGRILESADPADADGEPRVVVEKFTGVWPDETCEPRKSDASLTNTWWKILRLGDADVVATDGREEPHLTLRESELLFEATVGCNQFSGGFAVDGDRLGFSQAVSTMKACEAPLDDWERQLSEVIAATSSWRIDGQALELVDADGETVALFQAVHLR